jgi:hypothetical protein
MMIAMVNKAAPPPIPMSMNVDPLAVVASVMAGDGIINVVVDVFIASKLEDNLLLELFSDSDDSNTPTDNKDSDIDVEYDDSNTPTDDKDGDIDVEYDGVGDS